MTHRALLSLILVVATGDVPATTAAANAPGARIFLDARAGTLVLDLAPMDLPANTPHHGLAQPPVATLEIPETGFIYGFRVQVVDSAGHSLPDELIHHFNLIDPDHRELFLPISRRLLAAGHETGTIRLPRLLFGLPLKRGDHVVASAMVENLTPTGFRQARLRLVMSFTPAKRPWPLFSGQGRDRKSTRLNSSHGYISYAVFCLKKKKKKDKNDHSHFRTQYKESVLTFSKY